MITLPNGGYRIYYTQILPQLRFPCGANDYGNETTRILSAFSIGAHIWNPESGMRLAPQKAVSGELRVVSSEVIPAGSRSLLRMYYESCAGS